MACEYCGRLVGHDCRCPNYEIPKSHYYCCYCGEGILNEEKYLKNDNGECIHDDCIPTTNFIINWLGYNFKTMEDDFDV